MECQVVRGMNLVFCNDNFSHGRLVKEAVQSATGGVISVFVQRAYDKHGVKRDAVDVTGNDVSWANWLQGKATQGRPVWRR